MSAFYKFFMYEEQKGYHWNPVEVNTILQVISINDVNLNQGKEASLLYLQES